MSDATVAQTRTQPADLFENEWLASTERVTVTEHVYLAATLLDLAWTGFRVNEDERGRQIEDTSRALIEHLVRVTALGAQILAKESGLLPSQREGAA